LQNDANFHDAIAIDINNHFYGILPIFSEIILIVGWPLAGNHGLSSGVSSVWYPFVCMNYQYLKEIYDYFGAVRSRSRTKCGI
jgi:hypothetical protein